MILDINDSDLSLNLDNLKIESKWCGLITYQDSMTIQNSYKNDLMSGHGNGVLLGFENENVVTLGIRGDKQSDLNWNFINSQSINDLPNIVSVNRGGQATLHNPGQLIIYPILNLRHLDVSVRDFVCALQNITVKVFSSLGVEATKGTAEPGVYTKLGKIAFFGIKVEHGVVSHGLSMNVSNDLSLFSMIVSCGIQNQRMDSLKNNGLHVSTKSVYQLWCHSFFEYLTQRSKAGTK